MKYLTFKRDSNKFDDILLDPQIKNKFKYRITWNRHLLIGIDENNSGHEQLISYILLKHGDDVVDLVAKDYTPVPNVDYIPKKN